MKIKFTKENEPKLKHLITNITLIFISLLMAIAFIGVIVTN